MTLEVYSIRDILNGFMQPSLETNRDSAIRNFRFLVNDPHNQLINFQPSDYELFYLGKFNQETAQFETVLPELVVRGVDVFVE